MPICSQSPNSNLKKQLTATIRVGLIPDGRPHIPQQQVFNLPLAGPSSQSTIGYQVGCCVLFTAFSHLCVVSYLSNKCWIRCQLAGRPVNRCSTLDRDAIPYSVHTGSGSHPDYSVGTWGCHPEVKTTRAWSCHVLPPMPKVRKAWRYTSISPYILMANIFFT